MTNRPANLKSPFPWFGGKSRAAEIIWNRFGEVPNYCEPFAGSLAVLLFRPTEPGIETVNDLDRYVANFWRAVQSDPEAVAAHANWPVNEVDLEARHYWLVSDGAKALEELMSTRRELAKRHGVKLTTLHNIISGMTWKERVVS